MNKNLKDCAIVVLSYITATTGIYAQNSDNMQKKDTFSIGIAYGATELGAKTNRYDIKGKGNSFGVDCEINNMPLGRNWYGNIYFDVLSENLSTKNKERNVGNLRNYVSNLGLKIKKEFDKLTANTGLIIEKAVRNETYAGFPAEANRNLFGVDYGFSYKINDKISGHYEGSNLSGDCTDIGRIIKNAFSVSYQNIFLGTEAYSINATAPGIHQLYQDGKYMNNTNIQLKDIELKKAKGSLAYRWINGYDSSGTELEARLKLETRLKLPKKLELAFGNFSANKKYLGKEMPVKRTLIKIRGRF